LAVNFPHPIGCETGDVVETRPCLPADAYRFDFTALIEKLAGNRMAGAIAAVGRLRHAPIAPAHGDRALSAAILLGVF